MEINGYRLSPDELEQVCGGALTPEAESWIYRNIETIMQIGMLKGSFYDAMNKLGEWEKDSKKHTLTSVKELLKYSYGIDCLNLK